MTIPQRPHFSPPNFLHNSSSPSSSNSPLPVPCQSDVWSARPRPSTVALLLAPMRTPIFLWAFSIFLGLSFFLVSGQCLEGQKSLLLQLQNDLKFSSPSKLDRWNQSLDCCSWAGVSCDEGGLVTGLDLTGKSISGGIESLFNLQNLQSLNLSSNNFSSTIPRELSQLRSLKFLNLSNAGFRGQIPVEVSQMTRLVSFDLSTLNSYLTAIPVLQLENPNLIELVKNLRDLEELYVDGINLSSNGYEWWSVVSSSLPKLRVLSLSKCSLSGSIDSSLSELRSLSVIRLDNNNFSGRVPDFFANFSSLTSLQLSSSGLSGEFPEKIFLVPTLQTIDLSDNKGLHGSLPEFPSSRPLQILKLSRTNFSGMLPNSIGNLKMLSVIELTGGNFSGSIPKSMENLTQLVSVDFSLNGFDGTIPSFNMSKDLTQIVLSHNRLFGQVPLDWEGLGKLENLDLGDNALNGSIPEALFSLPSLKKIQLSNNLFSGRLNVQNVSILHVLDTLDLSSNNLEGWIPRAVYRLHGLKVLSLSSNNFSSSFQLDQIQQMKNLSVLDLSHNSLSVGYNGTDPTLSFANLTTLKLASCKLGTFPEFLKDQLKLEYLDLSMNQIQGDVPEWIWKLPLLHLNLSFNSLKNLEGYVGNLSSNMRILDLHSNQLQGPIKIPPSASYLDYSSNNFSSIIPKENGTYFSSAVFLSLSSNNFSGEIPESICNGTYLQVLDMSNNSLSGQIPECLMAKSKALGVLNLRRNKISGIIPDTFTGNCLLKTLDLSENLLEGKIPQSLANCTSLEVLNLGNNRINDTFPCHLKNRSTSLRVLVLRSNHFYGEIGCPHINATWQKLQIVDLASNNFNSVLPLKALRTWSAMMINEDLTTSELKPIQFSVLTWTNGYYQDAVTITNKGYTIELVKILTVFTSIDFSCNKLVGQIPEVLGKFNALYTLNLSHNALSGEIPTTMGNLLMLESLDLSVNNLNGTIPTELADLTFLSFLNLSHNQLVGMIPTGTQLQSFVESSFEGNKGLCGPPLRAKCPSPGSSPTTRIDSKEDLGTEFDWRFIYTGLGFGVGSAVIVAPLMFWRSCRTLCDNIVDQILLAVFPLIGLKYTTQEDQEAEEDEDTEELNDHDDYATNCGQGQQETEQLLGGYCVFCTKLDISRKRAIHNQTCTCHDSPSNSCFSSLSSSTSRSS